jgi:GntR family transcriptional repressor for pyruvate dehydrogenase complex
MRVTDDAIDRIKAMLLNGELKPGEKLPREPDLAERLGLSRNSLREAVKALTLIRVLDVRQGDGTYVTSLDPSLLMETMSFVVDLHQDSSVLDFFEVRRIMEPAATALAATRMSDADVVELARLLESLGPDPTLDELVANDLEFHRRIAEATDNQVLCTLSESLTGPLQRARIWRGLTQDDAVSQTLEQHWSIQRAIAAHDTELARSLATMHVAGVEAWVREALEQ